MLLSILTLRDSSPDDKVHTDSLLRGKGYSIISKAAAVSGPDILLGGISQCNSGYRECTVSTLQMDYTITCAFYKRKKSWLELELCDFQEILLIVPEEQ